jgi:hypothetical protein
MRKYIRNGKPSLNSSVTQLSGDKVKDKIPHSKLSAPAKDKSFGDFMDSILSRAPPKASIESQAPLVVEKKLEVSLEEIYEGCTKMLRVKRKIFDPKTSKNKVNELLLEFPTKVGLKAGSKNKFKDAGDRTEDGSIQDLHFILKDVSF